MRHLSFIFVAVIALSFCSCASAQRSSGPRPTTVRLTTDEHGHVATVKIIKSSGSAILDRNTVDYIKQKWHGPPNASKEVTFEYRLQPQA